MPPLTDGERQAIRGNLFPESRAAIGDWDAYPWHRHEKRITTGWVQSSQALSIDVFGYLKTRTQDERDVALGLVARELTLPEQGPWQVELEYSVPRTLLGEWRPTQIDALASSPHALIAFECKFTEAGGACSRTGATGQCGGAYALEPGNPHKGGHRCALTAKGIRYWEHVPALFKRLAPDRDHDPCPFAGERYQWMRNLAAARALADGRAWGVAVVYVDAPGLHAASIDWPAFRRELAPKVNFKPYSYQDLLITCSTPVAMTDRDTRGWDALLEHVVKKIRAVAGTRSPSGRN